MQNMSNLERVLLGMPLLVRVIKCGTPGCAPVYCPIQGQIAEIVEKRPPPHMEYIVKSSSGLLYHALKIEVLP